MDKQYEFDSDNTRWKYYKSKYSFVADINELYDSGSRIIGNFTYTKKDDKVLLNQVNKSCNNNSIELAGDCFFNFNDKKIELFKKIRDIDEETIKLLDLCHKNHHSDENCVLIPRTGALNNVKGNIYYNEYFKVHNKVGRPPINRYDRPDTFIYFLSEFWNFKKSKTNDLKIIGKYFSNSIFSHSLCGSNFEVLYDFLNQFENTAEFCSMFFNMDSEMTDEMIKNGKIPITNKESLNNYIKSALKFWKMQKNM